MKQLIYSTVMLLCFTISSAEEISSPLANIIVNNTNDSGSGSLRAAIMAANTTPGDHTIVFDIPSGPYTIAPASQLPALARQNITIDGTTQPGFVDSPIIVIDGFFASAAEDGLSIAASGCTIKGLVIVNFNTAAGIGIGASADNTSIFGCYIGADANGTTPKANSIGIRIQSSNNIIGGPGIGEGNVISGNDTGILISSQGATSPNNNVIQGNLIGVNAAGNSALPNVTGIIISASTAALAPSGTLIGGSGAGEGNVISCNSTAGIELQNFASDTTIQGNHIGTDSTNTLNLGNIGNGIAITPSGPAQSTGTLIGGTAAGQANAILFNFRGVLMAGTTFLNPVLGNSIFANTGNGIQLITGANCLQAPPVISSATYCVQDNNLIISFTVPPIPTTCTVTTSPDFRLEFFNNPVDNGVTEGLTFIGAATPVTAGTEGTLTLPGSLTGFVSSTGTDLNNNGGPGNTSPFSANVPITSETINVTLEKVPPGPLCFGNSKQLVATVSGALGTLFDFRWSDNTIQSNIPSPAIHAVAPVSTTLYSVDVTDLATSCAIQSASTTVTIADNPSASLTANPATICAGRSAVLNLTILAGMAPFSILWSDGTTQMSNTTLVQHTVTPGTTTNYSASITDANGCVGTSSTITVTVLDNPSAKLTATPNALCVGTSAELDLAILTGTAPFSILWSDGTMQMSNTTQVKRTVTPDATTDYSAVITDTNGCIGTSSTARVTVSRVGTSTLTATPSTFREGGSSLLTLTIAGSTRPVDVTWSDGFKQSGVTSPIKRTVTPSQTTRYFATFADAQGCVGRSPTVTVTVRTATPIHLTSTRPVITRGQSSTLIVTAVPQPALLKAAERVTLFWSDGAIDRNVTLPFKRVVKPRKTTNYRVVAQNIAGVRSASNLVTIKVVAAPLSVHLDPIEKCVCPSHCVHLKGTIKGGQSPFTSNGSHKTIHSRTIDKRVCPHKNTRYRVKVRDSAGNSATSNTVTARMCGSR